MVVERGIPTPAQLFEVIFKSMTHFTIFFFAERVNENLLIDTQSRTDLVLVCAKHSRELKVHHR